MNALNRRPFGATLLAGTRDPGSPKDENSRYAEIPAKTMFASDNLERSFLLSFREFRSG